MLIDKKLMNKHLFLLGFLPPLVSCIVTVLISLVLYNLLYERENSRQKNFIKSIYNNIQLQDKDAFNLISDALLVSGAYYSITLFDSDKTLIASRGTPVNSEQINHISIDDGQTVNLGDKLFFSIPVNYFDGKQHFSGKLLIGRSSHNDTIWLYQCFIYLVILCVCILVLINFLTKKFREQLLRPTQIVSENIRQLRQKNYGHSTIENGTSIFSPLINEINQLSKELDISNQDLKNTIDQSITELRETLETVEIQNIEIDLARKNAVKANQAKSEFLASTSHEIRTPLNGIIGFANLLRKTQINDKQREYIDTIEESANILLLNINDILDYSRLEIGKLNLDYKPVDIRSIVEETQGFVLTNNTECHTQLPINFSYNTPLKLLGDPLRVKQVYNNLLINAIDLCPTNSIATHVDIEDRDDNQVTLKITITAKGQFKDNQRLADAQKILIAPSPDNEQLTSKNHMGLIIAKGLVNRMYGEIALVIKPHEASFCFTLLLGQPNTDNNEADVGERFHNKILVVDDNPSNRRLVCELLADIGVETESASSGEQAIELCQQESFSLILMDIQMPGLDGFETTKCLRDMETNGARTPIVALTAHAVEEEKSTLLKSGMDDFLSKPIGETELKELMSRWTKYSPEQKPQTHEAPTTIEHQPEQELKSIPASNGAQPVNISKCLELAKNKHDLAKDMLEMLLDSLTNEVTEIEKYWQNKDYDSLHQVVHRIHGGACYSGVPKLLESSALLDKTLKDKHYDVCEPQLNCLMTHCRDLIKWHDSHDLDVLFSE
ncbi:response regulator [Agarilytica rhodophyticola]|uniref:response regulator n=1 Tax=Agarilytica rhodophyticola TaxID=1737490 RepID=UPI000B349FF6|nr:response regulator [Agarilytica rhodophyticola]